MMFRFENISVRFNGRYVLRDFSLEIRETEKVILYGRSGAGKSTLIKLLLGFVKPGSGKLFYKENLISRNTVWQLRNDVAYISQDMEIGSGLVSDYFDLIFSYKSNSRVEFSKDRFDELAQMLELPYDSLGKNIEELSGGEKQRIMIIAALMLNRKIFFLDEITSGLDLSLKQKVIDYFLDKPSWTELIVSHDTQWLSHNGLKLVNMEAHDENS